MWGPLCGYPLDWKVDELGAFDERTGQPLPLDKVKTARARELNKMEEREVKKVVGRSPTTGTEDSVQSVGAGSPCQMIQYWGTQPLRSSRDSTTMKGMTCSVEHLP